MTAKFLAGAYIKLQRAQEHFLDLEQELKAYLDRKPFGILYTRPADEPFMVEQKMWCNERPAPRTSAIIGDLIHNLRTALDHLANDVVALNGHPVRTASFPFAFDEPGLKRQIKEKKFNRASDQAIKLLYSLKPYKKDGNSLLRGLHDLDNYDKHNSILLSVASVGSAFGSSGYLLDNLKEGEIGGRLLVRPPPGALAELQFNIKIPATFTLYFPVGNPFDGYPVTPILHRLIDLVQRILQLFASEQHNLECGSQR